MTTKPRLILIYNADKGPFNTLVSIMHRVFSPATYECHLCYFTHNVHGMVLPWKTFLESLGCPLAFYYRTEFRQAYPGMDLELPAILVDAPDGPVGVLKADEIRACGGVEDLIALLRRNLSARLAHVNCGTTRNASVRN